MTTFLPFTDSHLPSAAALLAARHKRNRLSLPLLPSRFAETQVCAEAIQALWQKKLRNGYAAFRGEEMIAYLLGDYTVQPWGRSGYVYQPGYALAEGEDAEIIQDLYARLGDDWVRQGVFSHNLYVSAADTDVIAALFAVGFGKERIDALLDLQSLPMVKVAVPNGVTARLAAQGDEERLASLSHIMADALSSAPYWHPTAPEEYLELKEDWAELAEDKDWKIWLALEGERALGAVGFRPIEESDPQMLASPRTVYLGAAVTQPDSRGRGVANLLTWNGLNEARRDGYETCYTNWISPNLLAARYWPRFGFEEVSYRLSKQVNPRIAWTRG
jgi:GNAT superfamily N-acetyltransferase